MHRNSSGGLQGRRFEERGIGCGNRNLLDRGVRGSVVSLEVHHKRYTTPDPWDEPPENLETRCANCHGERPVESLDVDEYRARLALLEQKLGPLNALVIDLLGEGAALKLRRPLA